MNLHFYYCEICKKLITILCDTGMVTVCCGQTMRELIPNTTDGAAEKHVPVYSMDGCTILARVGSEAHPMTDEHSIAWIGLRTAQGFQFKELRPGEDPEVCFAVSEGDRAEAVYAFCNLHGLWCKEIE